MQSATVLGMLQLITKPTSDISSPLEVRSVVTRIFAWSLLNIARLATRSPLRIKECSWVAGRSSLFNVSQMSVHSLQVFTNTMIFCPGFELSRDNRYPGFNCSAVKMQFCMRVLTVFLPAKVECFWKSNFTSNNLLSLFPQKFSSIVAVAKSACLSSGMAWMMLRILGSIFSQKSRSASSSTKTDTLFISSANFYDLVSISAILPGVPTTTWGQFSSQSNCLLQLTPPTINACRRLIPCPKTPIC